MQRSARANIAARAFASQAISLIVRVVVKWPRWLEKAGTPEATVSGSDLDPDWNQRSEIANALLGLNQGHAPVPVSLVAQGGGPSVRGDGHGQKPISQPLDVKRASNSSSLAVRVGFT